MSDSITKFEEMKNEHPAPQEIQKSLKAISDIIHKPQRYASREVNGMDVIDLVKHWNLNFNEGNILKYLLRDKGQDISDLEKIIDYAQREIKHKKALLQ